MPPSTIVAPDVATRVCWQRLCSERRNASFMVLPTVESVAVAASGPRLPSSRPIDHRWDRSRGIIFGSHVRKLAQDNTWSPNRGIIFTQPSTPSRSYASRRIGVSHVPSDGPVNDTGSAKNQSNAIPDPYRIPEGAFSASHENIKKLSEEVARLQSGIEQWKSDYERLSDERNTQQVELGRLKKEMRDMERRVSSLNSERSDPQQERTDAGQQIARLTKDMADLAAASVKAVLEGANARKELEEIREISAPDRYKNEKVLEGVRRHTKRVLEDELLPQINQLNIKLKEEQTARQGSDARVKQLQSRYDSDRSRLENELQAQRTSLSLERKHIISLQSQLDGRRDRKANGRAVYATYRLMFDEFLRKLFDVTSRMNVTIRNHQLELELWNQALHNYERSWIHQQLLSTHPVLCRRTLTFFDEKLVSIRSKLSALSQARNRLSGSWASFGSASHASRSITRFFHMQETQPMHEAEGLSHDLFVRSPLNNEFSALNVELEETERQHSAARPAGRPSLLRTLNALRVRKGWMRKVANHVKISGEIGRLQALLDDDPVEKEVYVKTHRLRQRIEKASLNQARRTRKTATFAEYRQRYAQSWASLNEYTAIIRRLSHLTDQLRPSREEDKSLDKNIRAYISMNERILSTMGPPKSTRDPSTMQYTASTEGSSDGVKGGEASRGGRGQPKVESKHAALHKTRRLAGKNSARASSSSPPSKLNIQPTKALQACHPQLPVDPVEDFAAIADLKRSEQSIYPSQALKEKPGTVNAMTSVAATDPTRPSPSPDNADPIDASHASVRLVAPSSDDADNSNGDTGDAGSGSGDSPGRKLTYQIPPDDFRAAAMASPNTTGAYWHYQLYKNPDGKTPTVFYFASFDKAEERLKDFTEEAVLGFDLEWEPASRTQGGTIKSCISLIQVACEDKIVLIHVARFSGESIDELLPPTLRSILESPKIVKAGVNISGDASRMRRWLGVDMRGVFELSHLYRIVKFSEEKPHLMNFRCISLADQVQEVLMLPLKKDDVRTSRWSRALSGPQSQYAAIDAYAGFRLFHSMDEERELMRPTPPRPAFVEEDRPLVLGDGTEIFRSQKRTGLSKKRPTDDVDPDEGEEFFDAVETLDGGDGSLVDVVEYPDLDALITDDTPLPMTPNLPTDPNTAAPQPTRSTKSSISDKPNSRLSPSLELQKATTWASEYLSTRVPRPSSPPSSSSSSLPSPISPTAPATHRMLQAYHLWYVQRMPLREVAAHCRDPPLAITTVARYVLTALAADQNLGFENEEVKTVLGVLPQSVLWRFQGVLKRVGGVEDA